MNDDELDILITRFVKWAGSLTSEQERDVLKATNQLDDDRQWRFLRLYGEARLNHKLTYSGYSQEDIEGDPLWPSIKDQLKKRCDDYTDETADGEDFYEFAVKLLGPDGMRYYRHFMNGGHWRD